MALSGAEALERLREGRFDAITLDILMPGMSGFEVLRTLRADPHLRGIPVVVVSVFSGREALAGEWVVPKPIDADELPELVTDAGRRLGRIWSETDLLTAECLRAGVFRGLTPAELAGVVSALVFEARRDAVSQPSVPAGRSGSTM